MSTLNRTFSVKNGIDVANTIIVDSNRNVSNVANLIANTGQFNGNVNVAGTLIAQNIIPAANVTYNLGSPTARFKDLYLSGSTLDLNGTTLSANNGELRANTFNAEISFVSAGLNVLDQANTARTQANTAYSQANDAYGTANSSYAQANAAYGEANNVSGTANAAYAQANAAYGQANAARTAANSAANTVRVSANGGSTLSGKQLNFVNTATALITVADAADGNANITVNVIGGGAIGQAYDQANTARDTANAAYAQANTADTNALNAYGQANAAYGQANTGYGQANAAYSQANTARGTANDAYAQANAAYGQANNGYAQANAAYGQANAAYGQANAAYGQANAAYGAANLKLNLTGGTVSGDLTVQGNLYLTGNATYLNVATLAVNDSIIQLSTNSTSDALDIGFVGHYSEDGGTTNLHAGFIRHASDNVFYVFDGYGIETTNNVIDIASANLATIRANVNAATLLINGNAAATQANLTIAHNQANAAYGQANTARTTANDAYAAANTAGTNALNAYGQANAAYGQANAAYSQANAAYNTANSKVDTLIQLGAIQIGSGQTNNVWSYSINVNTASTTVVGVTKLVDSITSTDTANAATANSVKWINDVKVAKAGDTMTGNLTITTSGIGLSVANANVTYSLQVGTLNVTTNTVTTAASGQVVLDKFPATQLASAKYFVQANSSSDYHTTEIVLVQDATNVWLTEYASIQTGPSLGSFTADISGGDVRLLFNATNSVNTIRSVRYGIIP